MATVPNTPISAKPALTPVLPTDRFIGVRTPQNQTDPSLRVGPVSLGDAATALRPLLNLTTNNLPGTDKRVRFLTAAQLAADTNGGDCLDNLDPATLVLGGLAWVEFHPTQGYGVSLRLLYDSTPRTPAGSGLNAYRTGDMVAGDTVPVRWVLAGGPEVGVPAYAQKPTGYIFAVGELVRAYVSDIASEQFFAALAATALPAPTVSTGDVNWRSVSGLALPAPIAPLYAGTGTNTNGAMTQAATTTALGLKVDKVTGLALSSNDYTSPEKAKLAGLIMPANTDALPEGTTNKYFTDPRAVAAKLTGYARPPATRAIAPADGISTALGLLETGLNASSAPLVGILPTGLVGYATLDAALGDRAIYTATNLAINANFVTMTVSNAFQRFPAYFDAKGATVFINDGVILAFPLQDITRFSINNTFFIQQNTTASTAIIDFLNNGNPATPAVEQLGQVFNTFSQIPYRLNNNTLALNGGYCVTVLGTGTLYLFGNARVGTVAAGVTVIDRRAPQQAAATTLGTVRGGGTGNVSINADGSMTAPSGTVGDTLSVLPYAASIAIDFNAETVRTLAATGSLAFAASVNVAALKTKELYITNTTGAAITLAFPTGWTFFPGPAPTTLAAGKQAVLTLRSLGTTDSTIKAAYVAQA